MSIDIEIIPTIEGFIKYGNLMDAFSLIVQERFSTDIYELPIILDFETNQEMKYHQRFVVNKYYALHSSEGSTISMSVLENEKELDDEYEILSDYGKNKSERFIRDLSVAWSKVNYSYRLSSPGGRKKGESCIQTALAAAIAKESNGYIIIVADYIYDIGMGIYSYNEFKNAIPLF